MPTEKITKLLEVHPAPWRWQKVSPQGSIADSVLILDATGTMVATMHEDDANALGDHNLGWAFTANILISLVNQVAR